MSADAWDPDRYEQFREQRARPFHDLVALVQPPPPGARVADLGCGPGTLTATLTDRWDVESVIGYDSSPAMLEAARKLTGDRFEVVQADIGDLGEVGDFDVIVANASLQWLPDHRRVLADWTARLRPGGQLAVQVPFNPDHPAHVVAAEVALEEPFRTSFDPPADADPLSFVLGPARYAECLFDLGFAEQRVLLEVYGFAMPSPDTVVDWMRGTLLTYFEVRLPTERFEAFVDRYRDVFRERVGDRRPYYFAFQRILMWGRLPL